MSGIVSQLCRLILDLKVLSETCKRGCKKWGQRRALGGESENLDTEEYRPARF